MPSGVTFEVLRLRLLQQIKLRINNGEFTERGLSRILGISQSQTHNVLKGARTLQVQVADRLLLELGLSAMGELDTALRLKIDATTPRKPAGDITSTGEQEDQRAS